MDLTSLPITHFTQSRMTLYHTPLSPECRAIRMMLSEKELEFSLQEEDFWQRRPEFLMLNPASQVPVLATDKGEVVCGSYSISEYLEEAYPEVQFFGSSLTERAEVRRIVDWFNQKFEREVATNILFEKLFKRLMGYGEPNSEAIRVGKRNLQHHLQYLGYLLEKRQWLAGDYLTLADIVAAANLSCLDYLGDMDWDSQPRVKDWYALIKSRPSFRAVLEDRVKGVRPPAHYTDPDF